MRALDALLVEGSVTRAAARAGMTTPAMSRALSRLRDVVKDPLFVRAGAGLVPTPFALSLKARAHAAADEVTRILAPSGDANVRELAQTLTVRANESVVTLLGAKLLGKLTESAPKLRVRFVPEGDEDVAALRDGRVDLDIGNIAHAGPELRVQTLFRDEFVGVARARHPLLRRNKMTPRSFAGAAHVTASRRGALSGPVDDALAALGHTRRVTLAVPTYRCAFELVAASELVTVAPRVVATHEARALPIAFFALPFATPPAIVGQAWSPRLDVDPAHVWLRKTVRALVPA